MRSSPGGSRVRQEDRSKKKKKKKKKDPVVVPSVDQVIHSEDSDVLQNKRSRVRGGYNRRVNDSSEEDEWKEEEEEWLPPGRGQLGRLGIVDSPTSPNSSLSSGMSEVSQNSPMVEKISFPDPGRK